MKRKKIIISLLPFLIMLLFPLTNFISLPAKYSKFRSLPVLLLFLIAFSLSILLIILFSKKKIEVKINKNAIYFLILFYIVIFSSLTILKHVSFHSTALDLGIYDQTIWGYSKGKNIINTLAGAKLLEDHVQPILFIITLIYWLFSTPITLLVIQTVVIALGALPLYYFARNKLKNNFSAILIATSFLLFPTLQYINLFDFHPGSLAISFFMFAFYFMDKNKNIPFFIFATLGSLCKEYFVLIVFMMGLYIILKKRNWKVGIYTIILALILLYINFGIIIPLFSSTGYHYFGETTYLGDSFGENVKTIITRPLHVIRNIAWTDKIAFFALLFIPVGLGILCLFSLETLLIALPTIIVLTLLKLGGISGILYHRPSELIPFIFLSSVLGILSISKMKVFGKKWMKKFVNKENIFVAFSIFIFTTAFLSNAFYGPFTILYGKKTFDIRTDYVKAGHDMIKMIPKEASVSTLSWIVPHLSRRKEIYRFRGGDYKASVAPLPKEFINRSPDYILLDMSEAFKDLSRGGGGTNSSQIGFPLNDRNYGVIEKKNVWVLLKKGANYEKGLCKVKEFFDKKKYPYLDITIENKDLLEKC